MFMNSVLSHNWGPSSGCSRSDCWCKIIKIWLKKCLNPKYIQCFDLPDGLLVLHLVMFSFSVWAEIWSWIFCLDPGVAELALKTILYLSSTILLIYGGIRVILFRHNYNTTLCKQNLNIKIPTFLSPVPDLVSSVMCKCVADVDWPMT